MRYDQKTNPGNISGSSPIDWSVCHVDLSLTDYFLCLFRCVKSSRFDVILGYISSDVSDPLTIKKTNALHGYFILVRHHQHGIFNATELRQKSEANGWESNVKVWHSSAINSKCSITSCMLINMWNYWTNYIESFVSKMKSQNKINLTVFGCEVHLKFSDEWSIYMSLVSKGWVVARSNEFQFRFFTEQYDFWSMSCLSPKWIYQAGTKFNLPLKSIQEMRDLLIRARTYSQILSALPGLERDKRLRIEHHK